MCLSGRSPVQGPDPGDQFLILKRFGKIIIDAGIQALNPVFGSAQCGQHQHRDGKASGAQFGNDIDSRHIGKHPVENDEIEGLFGCPPQTLFAIGDGCHSITGASHDFAHHAGRLFIVFDMQDAQVVHGRILSQFFSDN